MKSSKYYSLDECLDESKIIEKLDKLVNNDKIEYEFIDGLIKIKDLSLNLKEIKELNTFLSNNDVIEDKDYEDDNEDEDDEDDYIDDDY